MEKEYEYLINKIWNEDCITTMKRMPDNFVDSVITSPPYYNLRNYGWDGQWGLEPTFQEYLEHLWQMMDEVYRVLKPTGTAWINLGDSYNGSGQDSGKNGKEFSQSIGNIKIGQAYPTHATKMSDIPNKCLLLIPHRFAIGCIERGWIVRNDCIWAKRNGMPESVTDRFSKKHEYFFFMVKNEKYYFDLDAIRDKHKQVSLDRALRGVSENNKWIDGPDGQTPHNLSQPRPNITTKIPKEQAEMFGSPRARQHRNIKGNIDEEGLTRTTAGLNLKTEEEKCNPLGKNPGSVSDFWDKKPYSVIDSKDRKEIIEYRNLPPHEEIRQYLQDNKNKTIEEIENHFGGFKAHHWFEKNGSYPSSEDWIKLKLLFDFDDRYDSQMTEVFLKSGEKQNNINGKNPGSCSDFWNIPTKPSSAKHYASYNDSLLVKPILAGCPEGGIIYDPFMGTGSTAEAALRANRNFIGSEGKKDYCDIANKRLSPFINQLTIF